MVLLRTRMSQILANWKMDLPQLGGWRELFEDCEGLEFDQISEAIEVADNQPVWPCRRHVELLQGAPNGSHICRAFDNVARGNVRVVILGQDPYPSVSKATGRAFEDGAWTGRTQELADKRTIRAIFPTASSNRHIVCAA